MLREQPELAGPVASDPVVSRLVADPRRGLPRSLKTIRAARSAARERARALAGDNPASMDGLVTVLDTYAQELKSYDMFVGEGTVYARTPLGVAQLARAAGRQHALDTLRGHPGMRRTAGRVLRRTGLSSRLRDRI